MSQRRQLVAAIAALALSVAGAGAHAGAAGAAACASADAAPAQASRSEVARASLCVINAERRSRGLQALGVNPQLAMAARRHSLDMVRRRYFAHTAPTGVSFVQRIRRVGYLSSAHRWLVGETLAWGWGPGASAHEIVQAWMRSPEHRRIVLTPAYREVGIGVVWGGPHRRAAPKATFTADFGVID